MAFWQGKRVAVSGAGGFLGRYLTRALTDAGARVISMDHEAEVFFNLAAAIGGIASAGADPLRTFVENARISLGYLDRAARARIPVVVVVSSACVYPESDAPLREDLIGEPVGSSRGYAYAKLVSEMQGKLMAADGRRVVIARGFNAYGPGDESDHVIPDLIRKIRRGGDVELWGGGQQVRSFTFASDWVEALMVMAEHAPSGRPINLAGDPIGISVESLARKLARLMGRDPSFVPIEGPVGHHLRIPDVTWLRDVGWLPKVTLDQGLERTVAWWQQS